ncbi:unnamed protein product [Bursaphelenchus okinawaensis]|uniref:Uncharacterized protein n=1 Tax=Bursaphelenchus okinawaensis TaxID=465554 RepID=A0A811LNL9_9BILA|nr:unnamed protein product [Bursaphelenchus okinawaensis]CAG9127171.1 unnamed protein product [Bursaphelenchus okinawaensis]
MVWIDDIEFNTTIREQCRQYYNDLKTLPIETLKQQRELYLQNATTRELTKPSRAQQRPSIWTRDISENAIALYLIHAVKPKPGFALLIGKLFTLLDGLHNSKQPRKNLKQILDILSTIAFQKHIVKDVKECKRKTKHLSTIAEVRKGQSFFYRKALFKIEPSSLLLICVHELAHQAESTVSGRHFYSCSNSYDAHGEYWRW